MRIYVKVIPRSSRNEVSKIDENEFRVKVTAPPVGGEANRKLIEVFSEYFKVSKNRIQIVGGKSAKTKIIDIL